MHQESGPAQGFTREPGCASPLPTPDSCFTAPCHPRASILLLSLLFPTSHQPHGSQNAACRPIFPVIFLAQHALTERLKLTLTPLVTQPSWRQGSNAVRVPWLSPGVSPRDQVRLGPPRTFPWPAGAALRCPAAGRRLGNALTKGDFVRGDFASSVRLRGPPSAGHGAGYPGTPSRTHCHLASRSGMCSSPPSALPAERGVQAPAASPPSSALSPLLPAPKVTSCLPQLWGPSTLLAQGHGAACLPASVSKQMEDISSLLHPSRIICLAGFLSGTPLLTASKSPVLPSFSRPQPSSRKPHHVSFIGKHLPKGHPSLPMQDPLKKDTSSPAPMEECLGTKSPPSPDKQAPSWELS